MKAIAYIAGAITIVTALSGFAWKAFSWDRQIQQNTKAISVLSLRDIRDRIRELQNKRERQGGRLSPDDARDLDELQTQKRALECNLYKLCK